jgi:hypothetical protein
MRGRILGLCLILSFCLLGCGGDDPDDSAFTEQRKQLEQAWHQGWEARNSLRRFGYSAKEIVADTCVDYFDSTEASAVGDDRFKNLARGYFVKGCLGVPPAPPT